MESMEQPDRRTMRALAKGVRVKMLAILVQRPATMQELATEVGERNLAIVNYHVKVLRQCGAVEPERGQKKDGSGCLYRARR